MHRLSSTIVAVCLGATVAAAQEHPHEHPGPAKPLTAEQLAAAIEHYIDMDMDLKGGWFLVFDTVDQKPLQLSLVRIHDDKLAHLGNEIYFACTDMKTPDGLVYDLDFFMERSEGKLQAHEISVHKKDGKPRYGWREENGIWKKVQP